MDFGIEEVVICSLVAISIISIIGVVANRWKENKGFGIRSIQFVIVTVLTPFIIVLTIMEILPASTIAVVVGIIIGYAFSKASGA